MAGELRLKIADFLNTKFSVFNLWHVVHFISGGIVMFFILKICKKSKIEWKFLVLALALVAYEVFELAFIVHGSHLFRAETRADIFLDLIMGFLGGFLVFRFVR